MMDYKEFLKTKEVASIDAGIHIDESELNPMLFPFQRDIVLFALRKGRSAIFSDCGTGKTAMQLEFANQVCKKTGCKALIIAPLSVVEQTKAEGKKFGIEAVVVRSPEQVNPGINITNYEIIEHFDPDAFDCVVLDECFAPDTIVETVSDSGEVVEKPISEIRAGDYVRNCTGARRVRATKRKKVEYGIKITFNEKCVVCSPRHPFFTQRGWVCAKDLQKSDVIATTDAAMRILRGEFPDSFPDRVEQKVLQQILLCEVENETAGHSEACTHKGNTREDRQEAVGMAENDGRGQKACGNVRRDKAYAESGDTGESICEIESDGACTFKAWGKWNRDDIATAVDDGCIARQLDSGITYLTGKETARIPDVLQSRLRELRNEDCNRDRWELSLCEKRARQEEGRKTGFYGLESFEVLERGCSELDKYRDADGTLYFYDLEIERHPSFTINGCLVHNSSILKAFNSTTRTQLIDMFVHTPYKLCCTATPAPNDTAELANTVEFLGVMSRTELLSTYFTHDSGDTSKWRLKGYGESKFWEFMATIAVCVRNPADLGYSSEGYNLPNLNLIKHIVESKPKDYQLVAHRAETLAERREARKESLEDRVAVTKDLVNSIPNESWMVWCDYNIESQLLHKAIADSVEVVGADSPEYKAETALAFADGKIHALVSKASIYGFGMNFQSCHNMIFCGISDSYEQFYQAIRRCWRYGQKHDVDVHIIISEAELNVLENIERKQALMDEMQNRMVALMRDVTMSEIKHTTRITTDYKPKERMELPEWIF